MKKILICLIALAAVAAGATCAAAPAPAAPAASAGTAAADSVQAGIGVLDMDRVIAESQKIKELQEQLNKKGQEITAQLAEIKPKLAPEQFQQRQNVAYEVYLKIKQDYEQQMDAAVQTALAQVAKEKKLNLIVYKRAVVYGGTDITTEVINKLR